MHPNIPFRFFSRHLTYLILCIACFIVAGCSGDKPKWKPYPAGTTVLAFGDSITAGTGAGTHEDYPSRLAALTGWKIINAGIPGEQALEAKNRITAELATHQPAIVLIELGGNDFLRRRNHEDVKIDLHAIITSVRQHGALPVLIAVPSVSLLRASTNQLTDAPLYQELAKAEKIPLVDTTIALILSTPALQADPAHPNAAGYEKLAHEIVTSLQKQGLIAH